MIFIQSNPIDFINIIQNLGFPIAVAIICIFFIWQVLKYVKVKLDEKDNLIAGMVDHLKTTQTEIVKTQSNLVNTQDRIANNQESLQQSIQGYLLKGK
jgi:hypothetical protein